MIPTSFVHIICFTQLLDLVASELYSSVEEINKLRETHRIETNRLESHLKKDLAKFKILNNYLKFYKTELEKLKKTGYVKCPEQLFKMKKNLTIDLHHIEEVLKTQGDLQEYPDLVYPDIEDLEGAITGLLRLQSVYRLSVPKLIEGAISGTYSTPMIASDIYEIGKFLYKTKVYEAALVWLVEATKQQKVKKDDLFAVIELSAVTMIRNCFASLGKTDQLSIWSEKLQILQSKLPKESQALMMNDECLM